MRDRSRAAGYADAWGRRKVLLTYPYVFLQLFRILDHWAESATGRSPRIYDRHGWYWPVLKTPAKLRANEIRWALVLAEINTYRKHYPPLGPNMANRPWPYLPLEEALLPAIMGKDDRVAPGDMAITDTYMYLPGGDDMEEEQAAGQASWIADMELELEEALRETPTDGVQSG